MNKHQHYILNMLQNRTNKFGNLKHTPLFSNISPITTDDKDLLLRTVLKRRPNSKYYEDSWGYIIQSARYGAFKWYDRESDSLIFFGRKNRTDKSLVVPSFIADPEYLCSTVEAVKKALKAPKVILKNINEKDIEIYKNCHFREYNEGENWNEFARYDDQTFPQSIVDLKKVVELKGKGYHHLRKTLRKDPQASFRKYEESDLEAVLEIFALRDGKKLKSPNVEKGMYYATHVMYPYADIDKYVIVDNHSQRILGFTAVSEITHKAAAFVALLFTPDVRIASVWGIYQTLVATYNKGYETMNFGGSESLGTDIFVKRNFQPIEQIKKTHLVYDPR